MTATTATVLLFFSGMIAFVPDTQDPRILTAYLVDLNDHEQRLRVPVEVLLNKERGCTSPCYLRPKTGTPRYCDCQLEDTTISLATQKGATLPPENPPGEEPTLDNLDSIAWLVRMERVNRNAAEVSNAKLEANGGGKISFGWNEGTTCAFEEAVCPGKIRRIFTINFRTSLSTRERHPVPELVMFKTLTSGPELTITLNKDAASVHLKLNCAAVNCPLLISNTMKHQDDVAKLCEQELCDSGGGDHFKHYRKLAKNPVGTTPTRLCGQFFDVDRDYLPICTSELARLGFSLNRSGGDGERTVGDRIICPSAVLQP